MQRVSIPSSCTRAVQRHCATKKGSEENMRLKAEPDRRQHEFHTPCVHATPMYTSLADYWLKQFELEQKVANTDLREI